MGVFPEIEDGNRLRVRFAPYHQREHPSARRAPSQSLPPITEVVAGRADPCSQFLPEFAVVSFSKTSPTVKLAALARGGNSLKLSMYFATMAWAGTNRKLRWTNQSP